MVMNKHIAVLMGGYSSERSISLSSGKACAIALETKGLKVSQVDVDRSIVSVLSDLKPDVALNVLHGGFGEGGIIQAILEHLEIPYTHSGVLASALSMDKLRAKEIVSSVGVPVCPSVQIDRLTIDEKHIMPPPYIIKPLKGGSSIGVILVKEGDPIPLDLLRSSSWNYGDQLLIEKYINGIELTCGIMGEKALDVTEIIVEKSNFYNYNAKYSLSGSSHVLPARISSEVYFEIQKLSMMAHKSIGCRGISRSDFIFDNVLNKIFWLEINSQPGMTQTSLFPEMAAYAGYSFEDLLSWMLEDASCLR
ncbi:D-alanine--D-alanine ligase [Candidatus Liberibacter americanus]|uniref:D-alanine--D-alanine ligase n=1 Tax=Candidatus Liberibacter americanus str. Sao Paulo TaxID=1261131 RepID=U6B4Y5_9HYPH|nr:D-alanine--D-alanine ligase [Candidatus Liberibacter americanus]AHA27960.1 D-alanine-D-alanine ligase [Candidatus Liberibacter americanus str. Sao Paulo]EMS35864.1 D-alanine--D-alanine ligase [Candidatus Liberibacter americanus PW_SP]